MYDRWVRAAHRGQVSGVVLLDLSAAFDLVDHQLLVRKLHIYGLDSGLCGLVSGNACNSAVDFMLDMHEFSATHTGGIRVLGG